MATSNRDVIERLQEIVTLMTLEEGSPQSFRVRAYENAIHGIEGLNRDVAGMSESELVRVKGVGRSTAAKVAEFTATGRIAKLEELRAKYPPDFVQLTKIPGLGPKTLIMLRAELGIEDLAGLRAALEGQKLRELPGLGPKSEEKISRAIERLGLHGKDRRTPIIEALPVGQRIVALLGEVPEAKQVMYCGSLRRFRDTIGDIDILAAARDPAPVAAAFVSLPMVQEVLAHGDTKSAILTRAGLQVDLRVVDPSEYGSAILYFTGSKSHNIALRQLAIDRGWILNEYGLADSETEELIAARTEKEIYAALELEFVPPTLREDSGEVEAAAAGTLPALARLQDVKGDLHYHTSLSGDGRSSLEEMVAAAADRRYQYLAITDHGEDLTINGATRRQMLNQRKKLARMADEYPGMTLLHGCELNIGEDGGLDYDPDFRMSFDWTVASVHSYFDLPQARQTDRLLAAMADPAVGAIGHLSGRYIGRRPGIEFDVDAVLEAARDTGTAIEINGALDRLDATPEVIRRGADLGVVFVIDTDSHHTSELGRMEWGVLNSQRGWLDRRLVANTWSRKRFLNWVAKKRA